MDFSNYVCDGQMSIFDRGKTPLKITKGIYIIESFSGIGAQMMALKRLADEGLCKIVKSLPIEIDKYAIKSYNAIHGTDFPTMDITKMKGVDLEVTENADTMTIMTYSFPCQ